MNAGEQLREGQVPSQASQEQEVKEQCCIKKQGGRMLIEQWLQRGRGRGEVKASCQAWKRL